MLGLRHYKNTAIDLWQGDITQFHCDVIVNATDIAMSGLGGVDLAIRKAAGSTVDDACRGFISKAGHLATGSSQSTPAGLLSAKYIIHAVAPDWREGIATEADRLAPLTAAYRSIWAWVPELFLQHYAAAMESTGAAKNIVRVSDQPAIETAKGYITGYNRWHIACPALGTGTFAVPAHMSAREAMDTLKKFLDVQQGGFLRRVTFVLSSKDIYQYFYEAMAQAFQEED